MATMAIFGIGEAGAVQWQGNAVPVPGDGINWLNPFNWENEVLPLPTDDLVFGTGTPGVIQLNANQSAFSLTFNENFTLGAYGTNLTLTNLSGGVVVAPGKFGTINAALVGSTGLSLTGGGTLFLDHPLPTFAGTITVDGAGTSLFYRGDGPSPQYNGVGGTQLFGRFDPLTLGYSTATRSITLSNGGELRFLAVGNNPETNHKNVSIGAGGGAYHIPAGFQQLNLDDTGQISNFVGSTFTKRGAGRLTIGGTLATTNPLAGDVVIDGGLLEFNNAASGRFVGMTGVGTSGTNTLTINSGGVLALNNGANAFDVASVVANNGAIIGFNGGDTLLGLATGGSTLTVNGTVTMLTRDLFGVQTQRFPRIHSDLQGSGTLQFLGNTNAGGTPRIVFQRSTVNSTFNGTLRILENTSLELNPRSNTSATGGTGTTVDTGKVLGSADVEMAGWGGTLDVRDSDPAAATVLNYTVNDIRVTTTQRGALNIIAPIRATTGTGTGHLFRFGALTLGDHRLAITGNNSYMTGFAETAVMRGNATLETRVAGSHLVFTNATSALAEDQAGRVLTLIKTGAGNLAAADVVSFGPISVSNLEVHTGSLVLRGAEGAIAPGFGGAAPNITINGGAVTGATRDMPTQGLLHLDNNASILTFTGGNQTAGNRVPDNAPILMRGNAIVRMTSQTNVASTETLGAVTVNGHGLFDVVKLGAPAAPAALTLTALALGPNATVNFTGTTLGSPGANTSRIVIPGTATGFLPAQYHQGNEWAKYDSTLDNGVELGVLSFSAVDYATNTVESTWGPGQQIKQTGASGFVLSGNRNADRYNFQFSAANQPVNLSGFVLTAEQGGILNAVNTMGFVDTNPAFPATAGGLTAGTTTPSKLYVYSNSQIDIKVPILDNLGPDLAIGGGDDSPVDFIKTGTGAVRMTHQSLGVGTGNQGGSLPPFATPTWTSTMTGSWIIDDGTLNVHRGQFLNGRPIVLNGGALEINHPVITGNANSILPGWGNNVTVNGNAMIGMDDNGESADAGVGGNTIALMGTLTLNNGSTLGQGSFNNMDLAFMNGTTINGRATINIGPNRTGTNGQMILSGVVSGDGFDLVSYVGAPGAVVLGGTSTDIAPNTFNSELVLYGGTVRLNKANGIHAVPDTAAGEDIVINGGTLAWGAGHHGDLATTNNVSLLNNNLTGHHHFSPASITAAGQNQVADSADITMLLGTLGEADRFNNETFDTLNQRNGTLNTGLGTMEMITANVTGGALNIDRGGTAKFGTLNLLPGAYSPGITSGSPGGAMTRMDIGSGGLNMTGQNITLGSGASGSVRGTGAILRLAGNVNVIPDVTLANSYSTGIYIQTGNGFREIGNSFIDLAGGNRTFNIAPDVQFFVTAPLANGGLIKSGGGGLILEPYLPSTFAGPITVDAGVLSARSDGAFGTSAGGVLVNSGGTVKIESSWVFGDDFTINGPGAFIPGSDNRVREVGALVNETGWNRLTGAFVLGSSATVASNVIINPSVTPGTAGVPYSMGNLVIAASGGITGAGTLTLSGHAEGVILNGLNTTSGGLMKDGIGRWSIAGASTFAGPTLIAAGNLQISHGNALGATSAGTTVLGGSLEILGGVTVAEPFVLTGAGSNVQGGAITSVSGNNTLTGAIQFASSVTIHSTSGTLVISGNLAGSSEATLTLGGAGNGRVASVIATGAPGLSGLVKTGSGTWTIAGANNLFGTTDVAGGTLVLDYTVQNNAKINAGEPLNLNGGSVTVVGNAGAATVQTVGALNVNAGHANLSISGGVSGATLNISTIIRASGATVSFAPGANGTVSTTTPLLDGILGGYATIGADWATTSGTTVTAFTNYVPLSPANTDSSQSRLTRAQTQMNTIATNSLKIADGPGLSLSFYDLVLSSGGLIADSPFATAIVGTGLLSGFDPFSELVIHTAPGRTLDVGVPVVGGGTGSLTKTGNGTLYLGGSSGFTGAININGGTLTIVGAGGTHPAALGLQSGNRNIVLNGGTFHVQGDYDLNVAGGQMQFVVGGGGGAIRSELGNVTINDPGQLSGGGDLTFKGGGRYTLSGGTPTHPNFTGNVTVEGGILTLGNTTSLGGRAEQVITVKPNSIIINNTGFGLGTNGLPNNMVFEGGSDIYALGGNRAFTGELRLAGTTNINLMERDGLGQERQVFFMGRVYGSNLVLNVSGISNLNPFYLQSGANEITGAINLGPNAALEVRLPGSLGINPGDMTVNLNGYNSRLLLRHYQNADYHANVNVRDTAEINSDRLVSFGGGGSQYLSIQNLTVDAPGKNLTFNGGNGYVTQVGGTATINGSTILTSTGGGGVLFENGIDFSGAGQAVDKRGTAAVVLHGAMDHTGPTLIQGGSIILQGANGTMPNTSAVELRGGELRLDSSEAAHANRLNDAAPITLGGGILRVTGPETIGTVTAVAGTTQVAYNLLSETVSSSLTLSGFTRQHGAVVQFQSDFVTTGGTNLGSVRATPRIILPGQADTNQTIPGLLGNNSLDFVVYSSTVEGGQPLGLREMRNAGSLNSPVYTNDTAETGWNDGLILRHGTGATVTLTASRALDAWKIEAAMTVNMGVNNLRIESGGILAVGSASTINSAGGTLHAGKAVATPEGAELIIGGNNTLTINAVVSDNPQSGQAVSLIKTGTGQLNLNGANIHTGGTYLHSGILNTVVNNSFGASTNPIFLAGGTLQFNIPNPSSGVALGGLGNPVIVQANANIILDNGATATTDNDLAFGSLTIAGPYTLGIRGFDSMDATFAGTHTFVGTPTIDLPQATGGSNPNPGLPLPTSPASVATVVTLEGEIAGSGFNISSSGNVNNTSAQLRIGNGEATPNTYTGPVTLQFGLNSEDVYVHLNKAPNTTAITGDLQLDGGFTILQADHQIADTSNLVIHRGILHFNGRSETIASVKMFSGGFYTNPTTGVQPANTINITGDVEVTGYWNYNFAGAADNPPLLNTGFTVGNNSTVNIGGNLRIGTHGRVHLSEGQGGGVLNVAGTVELTGAMLSQNNGAGANILRLNSDVTTLASNFISNIGNSTDSDTFLELNGVRNFNVADGAAPVDLSLSSVIRNSTSPVADAGIIKNGPGTMQIQGGGTANSYTGGTTVNEGTVILFKNVGVNAIPGTSLVIGDGIGGARADKVIVRQSNQISDAAIVSIASSGHLDLDLFNTSETIGGLSGSGAITLGANSVLTINDNTANANFSGSITGGGGISKFGIGNLEISGTDNVYLGPTLLNGGTITVTGSILGSTITVDLDATLAGTGTVDGVILPGFGKLAPGVNGAGTLNTGELRLNSGTFLVEIGGAATALYDRVNVTGALELGGILDASLINGYLPGGGDKFFIGINDGLDPVSGTFIGLPQGSIINLGGVDLILSYEGDSVSGALTGGNDIVLAVPEPGSAALLLGGLGLVAGAVRRRRTAQAGS